MAEIIDSTPRSEIEPDSYIVIFTDNTTDEDRQKHMDEVKRRNQQSSDIGDARHYAGIQRVFDHIKGYSGVFRKDVLDWIRNQENIQSVGEDGEADLN